MMRSDTLIPLGSTLTPMTRQPLGQHFLVDPVPARILSDALKSSFCNSANLLPFFTSAEYDLSAFIPLCPKSKSLFSSISTINWDLDLSSNRAGGDDLLGDAYEYLMRHFATESGKSKGFGKKRLFK